MRRWSQSEGGPVTHAVGASVVPKQSRPPRRFGRGLGDPKAQEAPSPVRREPRCSQSEGGPGGPKAEEATSPVRWGLGDPQAKEAPSPIWWGNL